MIPTHTDMKRSTSMTVPLPQPLQPQHRTHGGPIMSCIDPGAAQNLYLMHLPSGPWLIWFGLFGQQKTEEPKNGLKTMCSRTFSEFACRQSYTTRHRK